MLRLLYRLTLSLFFGLILALWIVQNNSHIEQIVSEKLISMLEKEWDVSIQTKRARINFFTCSLFLYNGKVTDKQHKGNDKTPCRWSFEKAQIHISPFAYLFNKLIHVYITINTITITTSIVDGQLTMVDHIKKMIPSSASRIPVAIQSIRLNNFDLTINHPNVPVRLLLAGHFELDKHFDGSMVVDNLDAFVNKKPLIQKMHGTCSLKKNNKTNDWVFTLAHELHNAFFDPTNVYTFTGSWSQHKRTFEFKEKSNTGTRIACDFLPDDQVHVKGALPTQAALNLATLFTETKVESTLNGNCSFDLSISTKAPLTQSTGSFSLDGLVYKGFPIKHIEAKLEKINEKKIQTHIIVEQAPNKVLQGNLSWDLQLQTGQLTLFNPARITPFDQLAPNVPQAFWVLKPRHLFINANFGAKTKEIRGTYKFIMLNQNTNNYIAAKGSYKVAHGEVVLAGKTPHGTYQIALPYSPGFYLKQWEYTVDSQKMIDLQAAEDRRLHGSVDFSLIRSFFDKGSRRLVLGNQAAFLLTIDQKNFSHLTGSLQLHGGKIYIPETRNLIEKISTSFECDLPNKFFAFNDTDILFGKGRLTCPKASIRWDDAYTIKMIHIPLAINNLFVNWKRDFYGFIYGNLLFNKLPDRDLTMSGTIVLKKSLLKDNIFSQGSVDFSSNSFGDYLPFNQRLKIDLHVLSEQPIRARTESLKTYANVDLHIRYAHGQNIAQFPQITGTINLEKGHLKFLRNKLNIEYGKIQFISNQLNDPMINLVASNRINKYVISLEATGSLQKPTIILESTPELTEEQIIGLLLAGSENANLQTDLIAMLQLNLHNIVLGSKSKLPKATAFLEKLARPLKYVQITPDFTDQSGRGGIRGTIAGNITDQLHAKIQKNFSKQEDFSAEVEYYVADDVSIKGVKDQRGEMGAEVEVRIKL